MWAQQMFEVKRFWANLTCILWAVERWIDRKTEAVIGVGHLCRCKAWDIMVVLISNGLKYKETKKKLKISCERKS